MALEIKIEQTIKNDKSLVDDAYENIISLKRSGKGKFTATDYEGNIYNNPNFSKILDIYKKENYVTLKYIED